ncbi:unnamed protein product [Arctogadus glacialis]
MLGVWERGPSEAAARAIVPQEKRLVPPEEKPSHPAPSMARSAGSESPVLGWGPGSLLTTSAPGSKSVTSSFGKALS